jgi:hypothetical protein
MAKGAIDPTVVPNCARRERGKSSRQRDLLKGDITIAKVVPVTIIRMTRDSPEIEGQRGSKREQENPDYRLHFSSSLPSARRPRSINSLLPGADKKTLWK